MYNLCLDIGEAKAWRMNELIIMTIHLAIMTIRLTKVTEDVIEVLAIDILPSFLK